MRTVRVPDHEANPFPSMLTALSSPTALGIVLIGERDTASETFYLLGMAWDGVKHFDSAFADRATAVSPCGLLISCGLVI